MSMKKCVRKSVKKSMKRSVKRRIFAALLAVGTAATLCACGTDSSGSSSQSKSWDEAYAVTEDAADVTYEEESGLTASGSADILEDTNEKIIYTYNYSVETKEFDEFMDAIRQHVSEYGGYMESSEVSGNAEMYISRYAYLVIRIPAEQMYDFLDMVESNSNVTYSNQSSENVTLSYVDLESHISALRTEQESLLSLMERAETTEDLIVIQSQLTDVRYELESYESQLRVYDNRINYSTLYLDVSEVERESSVATKLTYGEEIKLGLSDTMYELGQGLRSFSIWFIVNLPVLLLWVIVLAVIFLIVRKLAKRHARKEQERMASRPRGVWSGGAPAPEEHAAEEDEQ